MKTLLPVHLAALLCACSVVNPEQPEYDYYVLTNPAEADGDEPRAKKRGGRMTVTVGDVTLPNYLERESLATRTGEHQVTYSDRARWAEALDLGFQRVLRLELARRLEPIGASISQSRGAADYVLDIDVQRFEEQEGGQVALWARWSLMRDGEVALSDTARIAVPVDAPTPASAADALSQAVGQLGEQVATAVGRVARARRR